MPRSSTRSALQIKLTSPCYATLLFVAGFAAALGNDCCPAADWSQFRGPENQASSDDDVPLLKWSATEGIRWKSKLPGRGASSPIVVGEKIFLTAYSGYGMTQEQPGQREDLMLHVVCFQRESGELLWDKSFQASPEEQPFEKRLGEHGYASQTPVSDGKTLYAYFGISGLYAFDLNGNQLWQADTGTGSAGFGSAASPILFDDLVIVNSSIESKAVYAFDRHTGSQVWKVNGINRSWSTPTIVTPLNGSPELVVSHEMLIEGFNPRTGERLWTCAGIQDYVVPCVIARDGVIYCIGGRRNQSMAIKAGGRGDVTATHKVWEQGYGANVTSPVLYDGHLYLSNDRGVAYCIQASDGELVYQKRLPTSARVYASVVRLGNYLYATTRDEGVVVLAASPNYQQVAQNRISDDTHFFNATPAIHDGELLIRSDAWLYCIGK